MNVRLEIKYLSDAGKASQSGSFPPRGRKPEEVAFEWLQEIKRKVTYQELISVIANGDLDITKLVKELEKAPLD